MVLHYRVCSIFSSAYNNRGSSTFLSSSSSYKNHIHLKAFELDLEGGNGSGYNYRSTVWILRENCFTDHSRAVGSPNGAVAHADDRQFLGKRLDSSS